MILTCCRDAECVNVPEDGFDVVVDEYTDCLTLAVFTGDDEGRGVPCSFAKKEDIDRRNRMIEGRRQRMG